MNTENSFDSKVNFAIESYKDTQLKQQLHDKFSDKPLHVRLASARKYINLFTYLANFISFLTCLTFISYSIHIGLVNYFGFNTSLIISVCTGLAMSAIIEKLKRQSNESFFKNLFRYNKFSTLVFCSVVLLGFISVGASYLGAKQLPKIVSESPVYTEPVLTGTDATKAEFEKRIKQIRADKKDFFDRFKYRGKLSSKYNSQYENYDIRIKEQESKMQSAIDRINEQNEQLKKESKANFEKAQTAHSKSQTNNEYLMTCVVLSCELLFIIALGFNNWIDFRTWVLLSDKTDVSNSFQQFPTGNENADGDGQNTGADTERTGEQDEQQAHSISNTHFLDGAKLLLSNKKKLLSTYQSRLDETKNGNKKRDKEKLEQHVHKLNTEIEQIQDIIKGKKLASN